MPHNLGHKKSVHLFLETTADVAARIARDYHVTHHVEPDCMVLSTLATHKLVALGLQ